MITVEDLTVSQLSGAIAAAVFVVQILVPIALPIILLGLIRPRSTAATETAVSWSVIGRFLHSSLWPLFVHADSAATFSACKSAIFAVFFKGFMLLLIAVAAIVTPLGLYEDIDADANSTASTFYYVPDTSPMGFGTPPRDANNTWNRVCGYLLKIPCPNDYNQALVVENDTGISTDYMAEWYDSRVPPKVVDVLQSATSSFEVSVSSSFDIQYRTYVKSMIEDEDKGPLVDNGTSRTVGVYQPLSSVILNDDVVPIEGLIVDMRDGGIGFRNHSTPAWKEYGSTWTEDILFIVPNTVCVDTNLTLDFEIPRTRSEALAANSKIAKLSITDRGGFVNLNHTYPAYDRSDVQADPRLWYRAYRAAWLSNAYSMAYMNVTSLSNDTTGRVKSFAYLDSKINKTFPLYYPSGEVASRASIDPQSFSVSTRFGDYLMGTEGISNISTIGNETTTYHFEGQDPLYTNPFSISSAEWGSIDTLCRGQGGLDLANITNIATRCGVLNGAPRRNDDNASLLFDPGSGWSLSMYTCTSAVKAIIKTVKFQYNGTAQDISSLKVLSLNDKVYPNEDSKPLWGVENSNMSLRNGGPLWGMVTEEQAKTLNLSTIRKEWLYLPGRDSSIGSQNLPAADFASIALDMTYTMSDRISTNPVDYSGKANLAMFRKWQELSRTPATSAKILNLIWTDIAANMVVGTKGLHTLENAKRKRDDENISARRMPAVTSYTRHVKYHYTYGIPAFLALALAIATLLSTLFFMLFSGANPSTMRSFLQHTSAGRFLSAQSSSPSTSTSGYAPLSQHDGYSNAPTEIWVKGAGKQEFTLGPEGWMKDANMVQEHSGESGLSTSYAPVGSRE